MLDIETEKSIISTAANKLANGDVVAIPTETVYGLAADATQPSAIKKIFELKQRPLDHPLIMHIGCLEQLSQFAHPVPVYARLLAEAFWPGPLTIVLTKSNRVLDCITAGQNTVAIRMPNHKLSLDIIKKLGHPVVAPSANIFGGVSPTLPEHVINDFGEQLHIVDGGPCEIGIESTILLCASDTDRPRLLRPGKIQAEAIEKVLGVPVLEAANRDRIKTSGSLLSHYAPKTPVYLLPPLELLDRAARGSKQSEHLGIITLSLPKSKWAFLNAPSITCIENELCADAFAQQLYFYLRALDKLNLKEIIIETPPTSQAWQAVNDRLKRAAYRKGERYEATGRPHHGLSV